MSGCNASGYSHLTGQTLFLGASVLSFNTNMGWGRGSSLTVELIEDQQPISCYRPPYNEKGQPIDHFKSATLNDDHYDTCAGDGCYVDNNGQTYNPSTSKSKLVPGKVYYVYDSTKGRLVSKYWYVEDPGFFATGTKIDKNGVYTPLKKHKYNIIGIPVVFKLDNFIFYGIVSSWEKNTSATGPVTYTVNIDSFDKLLDNSYMIIDQYAGSVFSSFGPTTYGGPKNYFVPNSSIKHDGSIQYGNIHNVFNVYGFLESFDINYFGGAKKNDEGVSAQDIIRSLQVLTSTIATNAADPGFVLGSKRMYSPFGRLLTRTMSDYVDNSLISNAFNLLGVLPPVLYSSTNSGGGYSKNFFCLDLSDIPNVPANFRISGNNGIISIADFIRQVTDAVGRDFFATGIPSTVNNIPHFIIKIKTINRTVVPPKDLLKNTIESLTKSGLQVTQSSSGEEANQNTSKVMYIGGNQQRLLQAKNYRLAYSQTSYIYHPALKKFINFRRFNNGAGKGKLRVPLYLSTRNPTLHNQVNPGANILLDAEESIANIVRGDTLRTGKNDVNWKDTANSETITRGNYLDCFVDPTVDVANTNVRFIPLFEDVICPFFGYKMEERIQIQTTDSSNIFRKPRPVWLDSWTGQLAVYFDMNELPNLSIGATVSMYDPSIFAPATPGDAGKGMTRGAPVSQREQVPPKLPPTATSASSQTPTQTSASPVFGFVVTETEFRAAMNGIDSYLTYCLGKSRSTKPDLFNMLVNAYKAKGLFLDNRPQGALDGSVGGGMSRNGVRPPNTAGSAGQPSVARAPARTKLDMNWDIFVNENFIKDFQILTSFVASIGQKYYGRQYMVRLPSVSAYRDSEYATTFNIGSSTAYAFHGTGKIFYNYELTDSAWEEYGNYIDDCILVGDNNFYTLCDDKGMLPVIIGYNADDHADYVRKIWCDLSFAVRNTQLRASIPRGTSVEDRKKRALISQQISQNSFAAETECGNLSQFYIPSLDVSKIQDYIEIEVLPRANPWEHTPLIADKKSKKIFKKGSSSELAFLDPHNFSAPRAIISTEPIELNSVSYAYSSDPNLTVLSNIALEDTIIYIKSKFNGTMARPGFSSKEESYFRYMMSFLTPVIDGNKLVKEGNSSNQSQSLQTIAKKMAHPFFIGVPLKSNQFSYGPWVNYPHLDIKKIYGDNFKGNIITENLIDNIKIEKRDEFVPWNYGGISYLDAAVFAEMADSIDYQSVLEMGSITIQGTPIFEPGGSFAPLVASIPANSRSPAPVNHVPGAEFIINNSKYKLVQKSIKFYDYKANPISNVSYATLAGIGPNLIDYSVITVTSDKANAFLGPTISNMSMSVGTNGINTTYSFRTFSRKTGIWNKENIDRIKKQNASTLKLSKQSSGASNSFLIKNKQEIQAILDSSRSRSGPTSFAGYESKLFGSSPTELLIGQARPVFRSSNFNEFNQTLAGTGNLGSKEPSAGAGSQNSSGSSGSSSTASSTTLNLPYGIDPGDNITEWSKWNTNPVSGVLSTQRHSAWVGMYMADEVGPELIKEYNTKAAMSLDGIFSPVSFYPTLFNSTYAISAYTNNNGVVCPKCTGLGKITDTYVNPVSFAESEVEFACPCCSKGKPIVSGSKINVYTLNPIVVPYGEFRNSGAAPTDRCRHSINVVGRGEYNPTADQSFYIPSNLDKYVDPNTGYAVGPGTGVLADYYEYDIFRRKTENDTLKVPLNHRFFAFRGPMVLHGWGYDTDGYPVPNSADEPKEYDTFGRPKRFIKKADGTNDLTQDGAFLPPAGKTLGDIIGKGWTKNGSKWEKKRTNKFYLNWAERADSWPVGPIDVRWDHKRKVWSASGGGCGEIDPPFIIASGNDASVLSNFLEAVESAGSEKCPFKMVYVVLEENLIKIEGVDETFPARAFLDDVEYSVEPLPLNTRRLIYVKDRCGYSAPRGAKLLCRYDRDNGFYEPVTKQQYIVFGRITGGNNAIIDLTYIQGIKKPTNIPTMNIVFDNTRFSFSLAGKTRGMFMFENGAWILIGTN